MQKFNPLYLLLLLLELGLMCYSHRSYTQHLPSSFGINVGSATYLGELNPYNTPLRSIFGKAVRWHLSAQYEHPLSDRLSVRGSLGLTRIFGDDNLMKNVAGKEINYIRNLHFRNDLKQLTVEMVYHGFSSISNFKYRSRFSPYVSMGLSIFGHNPQARDVREDPDVKAAWVSLNPLKTEGQSEPYPKVGVAIPLSVGVKYRLKEWIDIGLAVNYNYTFTDYLDDVSTTTHLQNDSPIANRTVEMIAAHSGQDRSYWLFDYLNQNGYQVDDISDIPFQFSTGIPPFDTENTQRGNPKVNDSFILTKLSLIFYIKPRIKCPQLP